MKGRYTEDREWSASLILLSCLVGMLVVVLIKVLEKL